MYTGRIFRAEEEAASGLFNYVLPREEVLPRAMAIAAEIAENAAPVSVALSKAMLWHGLSEPDSSVYAPCRLAVLLLVRPPERCSRRSSELSGKTVSAFHHESYRGHARFLSVVERAQSVGRSWLEKMTLTT